MAPAVGLSAWTRTVAERFPAFSAPQSAVLAQWSWAVVAAGGCGLQSAALHLSAALGEGFDAARQRLREWYKPASAKSGVRRADFDPAGCSGPLFSWILSLWRGPDLAPALDATTLGDRFTVLAAAVLYRGTALPVAWRILPATARGAWKPHWLELLSRLSGSTPPGLRVLVLTDRGLYARWLFRAIRKAGWHPMMRVNAFNGEFRPEGSAAPVALADVAPRPGDRYCAAARGLPRPRRPPGLHADGLAGRGSRRPLAAADGSAPGGGRPGVVRPAGVDRAGVPVRQDRGLGLAADADDRPGAGRAAVVGDGGGDPAGGGRRRGGGR